MGEIATMLVRRFDLEKKLRDKVENFIQCINTEAQAQADQDAPYELNFLTSANKVVKETCELLAEIQKFK
jgi:hypothetical protein